MASSSSSAEIGIRYFLEDAASQGMYAIDSNLGKLGQSAKQASKLFGDMSLQMAGLAVVAGLTVSFLGFAGAMVYSVKQGMDLTQALTNIGLATGLLQPQLEQLKPFLFNLGADSIYSLQELADGISVVGQYGFKTTQQIEAMATAGVKLAEATGSKTTDAFKLLAVTMQAFNIPASKANETAALLFYSIEHGTPSISNLTSTLGKLGGVSTILHVSLQDMIPALDTVSSSLGTASVAGSGLVYFMTNIAYGTKGARQEMKDLGLSVFDAQGKFLGLEPVLLEITNRVKGMSDADKAAALGQLFNIRSGTAIKDLITQIDKYTSSVKTLTDTQRIQAQLDEAVKKVMDQLGSIIHTVTSNFQDFAALVGNQLIPNLIGLLGWVGPVVKSMREWAQDPAHATLVAHFLMLGAAVSGVGLVIVAVVASPLAMFVAIMLAVMGVVAGVAAIILNWKTIWASLEPILQRVWSALQLVGAIIVTVGGFIIGFKIASMVDGFISLSVGAVKAGIALLSTFLPALQVSTVGLIQNTLSMLEAKIVMYGGLLPAIMSTVGAWLASAAAMALAMLPYILLAILIGGAVIGLVLLIRQMGGLNVILGVARAAWAAILPALEQAGAAIKGAFMDAVKQLQPVWKQLVAAFIQAEPVMKALGMILGVIILVALGLVIGLLRGFINVLVVVITTVIKVVAGVIQVFAGLIQFFMGFFNMVHGLFVGVATGNWTMFQQGIAQMRDGVVNIFTGLWNIVKAVFVGAFQAIAGFVTGFINGIVGFFQGLANTLVHHSIFPDMLNAMVGAVLNIGPNIVNGFNTVVQGIINLAISLPGKVTTALGNLSTTLFNAGQSLVQGFINGLGSMVGNLMGAAGNMLNNVRNLFPHSPAKEGPLMDAHLWMPNLVHMLADTAEQAGPSLKASMGRVAGGAKAGIGAGAGGPGGSGGPGGGATYVLQLDGKPIMTFFHNQITGELQANGAGRLLR